MRLYTVCLVVFVAVAVKAAEKAEKRRAQNYGSGTTAYTASPSTASYSTATAAPVYATAATPGYATKTASKLSYVSQPVSYQPVQAQKLAALYTGPQQQFSYSFEAQPELKLALAQAQGQAVKYSLVQPQGVKYVTQPQQDIKYVTQPQQDIKYVTQPQQEVKYVAQPEVKYAFAQPQQEVKYAYAQPQQEVKYAYAQPQQEVKYAYAQPQQEVKYAYAQPAAVAGKIYAAPAPAKVAYPSHQLYTSQAQAQPQPHYSPADTVSSFKFSSPHVTYSNLGVLSQVLGKGYSAPQPQQVTYVSQPAAHAHAPAQYFTHNAQAQPVQYVASPQGQHSTQQVVYVPQGYAQAQKSGVSYA